MQSSTVKHVISNGCRLGSRIIGCFHVRLHKLTVKLSSVLFVKGLASCVFFYQHVHDYCLKCALHMPLVHC
jgi:hypothetical protein